MGLPISRYGVEIFQPDGTAVASLTGRALSRTLSQLRNRADTISLTYDLDNLRDLARAAGISVWDMFAINRNEVRLSRDGKVISAGQISYARPAVDGDSRTFEIKATGWLDLFASRYTGAARTFAATDAGQIAWALLSESQALPFGNYGITAGTIQASVARDRTYGYKNIRDALIQLSEVLGGFDFEFTWDKKFNVWYPKIGTRRDDIVFRYPGNIRRLSFTRDGTNVANEVTARGSGTGAGALTATFDDLSSQATYFLRQGFSDYPDVVEPATLLQKAQEEVRTRGRFYDMPDVTVDGSLDPQFGSYGIGDEVFLELHDDVFAPASDWFRIDAIDLSVDENDAESVRIRLMR